MIGAMDWSAAKRIHFIGIGGIGISAVARMFLAEGKSVTGSDQADSPLIAELQKLGAKIYFGHRADQVPADVDLVVYTIAVAPDNPELVAAQQRGLPLLSYPQLLGLLSQAKDTVAVAGTHGKTTTTAMLAGIASAAGTDPTVIVGSLLSETNSNFIAGQGELFIVEACEYRRSFLNLSPRLVIITNIDDDHLDYYRDLVAIEQAFAELTAKLPATGFLICDTGDVRLRSAIQATKAKVLNYRSTDLADLVLLVPGEHNRLNAQAALTAALALGLDRQVSLRALGQFRGTWRRFEFLGSLPTGAKVYDDYGHHPTEIKATLAAARSLRPSKLIVVFQPHLYSRTKLLFKDFVTCFRSADEVIILPIYAAREPPDPTIDSERLAAAINQAGQPARYLATAAALSDYLRQGTSAGDLVLFSGAGDLSQLARHLVQSSHGK